MCCRITTSLNPNKRTLSNRLRNRQTVCDSSLNGPMSDSIGGWEGINADFWVTFKDDLSPSFSFHDLGCPKKSFRFSLKRGRLWWCSCPDIADITIIVPCYHGQCRSRERWLVSIFLSLLVPGIDNCHLEAQFKTCSGLTQERCRISWWFKTASGGRYWYYKS